MAQEQDAAAMGSSDYEELEMSQMAENTVNPIRRIVDTLVIPKSSGDKKLIPLSIGDPTTFGNFPPLATFIDEIKKQAENPKVCAYQHSAGMETARRAIAERQSKLTGRAVALGDVIVASGCSGAIEIAIRAVASMGENILVPQPGFSIYQTIAESNGIQAVHYPLVPEKQWEADLEAMGRCINGKTRAIVVNNPSNPCGSVYSAEHLRAIAGIARRHRLPIIADEIYGNLCFEGSAFHPLAKLAPHIPVIHVGGIAKEFLVPGFRVGWIILHDIDAKPVLSKVRQGMLNLSQLTLGASSLVQAALPRLLTPEAGSEDEEVANRFHEDTRKLLEHQGRFLAEHLKKIPGIKVIEPQGAMYVMASTGSMDDVEFSQKLMDEELVFVLPGKCFGIRNYVRLVSAAPEPVLEEACKRMQAFCERHFEK